MNRPYNLPLFLAWLAVISLCWYAFAKAKQQLDSIPVSRVTGCEHIVAAEKQLLCVRKDGATPIANLEFSK